MKKKFLKTRLLCVCLVMLLSHAKAQNNQILTNAGVLKLFKADMGNDIILSKIETSACKFDVSEDGIIKLKSVGLPAEVIKAMMVKMSDKKLTIKEDDMAKLQADAGPVPEFLNEIYYYDPVSHNLKSLEKGKAKMNNAYKVFGGVQTTYELKGIKSTFRFPAQDHVSFMVSLSDGGGDPSGFYELYKLEIKYGKRIANYVKVSLSSGKVNGGSSNVSFNVKKANLKAFEILPEKLEKGEYFFLTRASSMSSAGSSYDVFAFGID